jgi:hypothetical protein
MYYWTVVAVVVVAVCSCEQSAPVAVEVRAPG